MTINQYHRKDGSKMNYRRVTSYRLTRADGQTFEGKPWGSGFGMIDWEGGVTGEGEFLSAGWKIEKVYS